jgi:hypothetical protein
MELTDLSALQFAGIYPVVVSRVVGDPMIHIVRHTSDVAPVLRGDGATRVLTLPSCDEPLATGALTTSPVASSSSLYGASFSSVALMAGAYLSGASFTATAGIGTLAQIVLAPPVAAQIDSCIDVVEIEIHGPAMNETEVEMLESENIALSAKITELEMMLADSVSMEDATQVQIDVMVENFARNGTYCVLKGLLH